MRSLLDDASVADCHDDVRDAGKDRTGTGSIVPGAFCKFREPDLNVSFNSGAAPIGGPEALSKVM
jgi:hypothetical protein